MRLRPPTPKPQVAKSAEAAVLKNRSPKVEPNPCRCCGNDVIETLPSFLEDENEAETPVIDERGDWSVGCKPCARSHGGSHVVGKTREEAIVLWNQKNPSS